MKWDLPSETLCDWVHGYLFSKPVTAEEAKKLIVINQMESYNHHSPKPQQ